MPGHDIIGDVHGCATELKDLLGGLGYERDGDGVYRHPERTAVFIGDLVDRGEDQLEVLKIAKAMVDAGTATATMGNHEFNAICYSLGLREKKSDFFEKVDQPERDHFIDWFRTLPLWLDLGGLRVIHACWHPESIAKLREHTGDTPVLSTDQHYRDAMNTEHQLHELVEILLKGPEIPIPEPYLDHDGGTRTSARLRWWDPTARKLHQLADVRGMQSLDGGRYQLLDEDDVEAEHLGFVYTEDIPVIYGHYWFDWEDRHNELSERTACVDFGAINTGKLVAYRWSGETTILPGNFWRHDPD